MFQDLGKSGINNNCPGLMSGACYLCPRQNQSKPSKYQNEFIYIYKTGLTGTGAREYLKIMIQVNFIEFWLVCVCVCILPRKAKYSLVKKIWCLRSKKTWAQEKNVKFRFRRDFRLEKKLFFAMIVNAHTTDSSTKHHSPSGQNSPKT